MKPKFTYSIGVDLGGTKLAAALVRSDGLMIDFIKVPLNLLRQRSALNMQRKIVHQIAAIAIDFKNRFPDFCKGKNFSGLGLASAGPLNVETGVLIYPANFPGWKKVPLKKMVEAELRKQGFLTKVYFQNDAIAAAYAEFWQGKAKNLKSYALVTVGTGIGSGVIINGKPCQTKGAGSEFGHSVVDLYGFIKNPHSFLNCTVEGIASGTALLRRARKLGFKGSSVEELVALSDPKYNVIYRNMAIALAALCFNLSIGFRLDAIFFSGGLIKIKERYLLQTQKNYQKMIRAFNPMFECPIAIAKTKNDAGVLGAAYLPYL